MGNVLNLLLLSLMIAVILSGLFVMFRKISYDEINDPNRDYHITVTDSNLIQGEIYEMEFIPAHFQQRRKTEMQAGMGFGVNPANGNLY